MKNSIYTKVSSYEARMGEVKKVVLLYSGGLDTSVLLKWIQDKYQAEVIALTLDLGQQGDDLEAIKNKALKLGAKKAYVIDSKNEFAEEYLTHMIKANGSYQGEYYISTVSRYLMAKIAIMVAAKEKADTVAHGCTGKGNDQVRLESSMLTLNPHIKIIAPIREWDMSRDAEIDYAKKHHIPVPVKKDFSYSSDDNMWGVTWEGGEVEDPRLIPQIDRFQSASKIIEKTPNKPQLINLEFKKGIPYKLSGKTYKLADLVMKLNKLGGKHGVGVVHHLEDRLIGLKTRGVYEHPGAHIIIQAHRNLEKYVCTRMENELKETMDIKFGYLCYGAIWFDPVMDDIRAFNDKINEKVDGKATVRLFKGQATVVAMKSPHGLHHVSFDAGKATEFNVMTSAPFIEVYSMQMRLSQQRAEKSALISIGKERQKKSLLATVRKLAQTGYILFATEKTNRFLTEHGVSNFLVYKINEKREPNLATLLNEKRFDLIVNIPTSIVDQKEATDGALIRQKAVDDGVMLLTTVDTAKRQIDKIYQAKYGHFA